MRIHRPTYADVAATLALGLALGTGGAYAAGLVTTKDLARNAVTSAKIKNGQVKGADLAGSVKRRLVSGTIASGTTVTGRYYHAYGTGAGLHPFTVNLPATAPQPLASNTVNFAPDASTVTTDDDATCTGSYSEPTAPAGKVCVYAEVMGGITSANVDTFADPAHRSNVFYINFSKNAADTAMVWGSWAYTAP